MTEAAVAPAVTPPFAKTATVAAKAVLVLLLGLALLYPDQGNLRDKAAGMRAVGYPVASFLVPALWLTLWRERGMSFPWVPDLLITITCFTDILGNRMDLYDTVAWFDDWVHFMNFVSRSSERTFAYADTLSDLLLGTAGAVVCGVIVHQFWRQGWLLDPPALQQHEHVRL